MFQVKISRMWSHLGIKNSMKYSIIWIIYKYVHIYVYVYLYIIHEYIILIKPYPGFIFVNK